MDIGLGNDLGRWILPLATAVGAWGGFPKAPDMWQEMAQNELFQYLCVFILCWQGGGQQDMKTAFIATAIIYFVAKLLEVRKMVSTMAPPPAEAKAEGFYY